jgi:large subunit ribosomal protein L9
MKVVLRQDVESLGERGQVVNVSAGYARNFLFPKKLALEATPGNLRSFDLHKKVWAAREAREVADAQAFAARLGQVHLSVTKKAGEQETLYGSVTSTEIAELLAKAGFEVDRRKILLDDPIKTLGTHAVRVKIHRQVVADVALQVVAEKE